MTVYRWNPVEPHEFSISVGYGVTDITWFWICKTHRYQCDKHMTVFMRKHVHRDRQERLL